MILRKKVIKAIDKGEVVSEKLINSKAFGMIPVITTKEFAQCTQNSDNYYVIATRSVLPYLSYSTNESNGIKNISGNKYIRYKENI